MTLSIPTIMCHLPADQQTYSDICLAFYLMVSTRCLRLMNKENRTNKMQSPCPQVLQFLDRIRV